MQAVESPLKLFQNETQPTEHTVEGRGGAPFTSYFQIDVPCPEVIHVPTEELTDSEVIQLAEGSNTFDFLNSPEEDIYSARTPDI